MQSQYKLDDGIIDAKLKVLQKLKDFVQIKQTLKSEIQNISEKYEADFKELWDWTVEQMFSEQNLVEDKIDKPVPVSNLSGKYEVVNRNVIRKPKPAMVNSQKKAFAAASVESRVETIRQTNDTEILAWGVVDANRFVRTEAVKNSKLPQDLLQKAVLKDANLKVKRIAIRYVDDESFLIKIAQSDMDVELRQKSIHLITDKDVLRRIISQANTPLTLTKAAAYALGRLTGK